MLVKTSELTPSQLNYAVGSIENPEWTPEDLWFNTIGFVYSGDPEDEPYCPSIEWGYGGPIIEREGITVGPHTTSPFIAHYGPTTTTYPFADRSVGPTPLVAAMRCFVATELGEVVDIPEELL